MPPAAVLPTRTERLEIRMLTEADAARFTAYRNHPDVARYQDWPLPWTAELTHDLLIQQRDLSPPAPDRWVQLAVDDGTGIVGDVAVWTDTDQQLATIGYTLAPHAQHRGYATEAVAGVLATLFDEVGVHRVVATLDPDNLPSARVVERCGFRYEGRSVAAALVRGVWSDDDRYAVLADEFRDWCNRPRTPPERVELVPVTPDNLHDVMALATHRSQQQFVATVEQSLADALVPEVVDGAPLLPWFRAIAADGELVGFVMIADVTDAHPHPYLWRFLVDRRHQGRGIGRRAIALLVEHLRSNGATRLFTSWEEGRGGPAPFYERLGFTTTGRIVDGEIEAVVELAD